MIFLQELEILGEVKEAHAHQVLQIVLEVLVVVDCLQFLEVGHLLDID